jgi:polar amino acid transport system substrate-binding protein
MRADVRGTVHRRALLVVGAGFGAGGARAATLRMAFGDRIPPFCFPESTSGIEVDVFREALALRGHELQPVFLPLARVPKAFRDGQVDAAMTDLGQALGAQGAHYGDAAVLYDNVFFSLITRGLAIRRPTDLAGLRVVAFQGAAQRYPDWLGPAARLGHYQELNDQAAQVRMLMLERCDAVLSDRSIFRWFSLQQARQGLALKPVREHRFTQPDPLDYRPVFRSAAVRDDFNAGLRALRSSGRYQAIYDRYLRA